MNNILLNGHPLTNEDIEYFEYDLPYTEFYEYAFLCDIDSDNIKILNKHEKAMRKADIEIWENRIAFRRYRHGEKIRRLSESFWKKTYNRACRRAGNTEINSYMEV